MLNISGLRGGAATTHYPLWHLEVESLLVLKNNRGVEDNRVRHMDYSVQINKTLYNRLIKGQNITLFSPSDVDGLYDAFFEDQDLFEKLYTKYEKDPSIRKSELKATELFSMLMQERASTGRIYVQNVDHCNTHGSFIESVAPIRMSNLCVAPETKILTREGYEVIGDLEGQEVDVWNGQEWSTTTVVKTSPLEPVVQVKVDDGSLVDCTNYHKWYVVGRDKSGKVRKTVEKRTHELVVGDELIKPSRFDAVNHGENTLQFSYESGFYSGDGCERGRTNDKHSEITFYPNSNKMHLIDSFSGYSSKVVMDNYTTLRFKHGTLLKKMSIPDNNFTLKSRIDWLAGLSDADGCELKGGESFSITTSSQQFSNDLKLFLQELGVRCTCGLYSNSKTTAFLPKGSVGYKEVDRNPLYVVCVSAEDTTKLLSMGLSCKILKLKSSSKSRRTSSKFVKIESVIDYGRETSVYCFTEPKRNMGMFNGILTGQCQEVLTPTKPLNDENGEIGEIGLCTLAAINLGEITDLNKDMDNLCDLVVRSLDALLDYQDYPVKAAEISTLNRRMLGVGVINFAYYLAKNGLKYSDGSANDLTHGTFESLQYHLLKASSNLAKEMGACNYFNETKYSQGLLPIDTYKESVDGLVSIGLKLDWENLREDISKYGLRNSTLSAQMPSETSSQVSNSTNGIESPRGLMSIKSSKDGILKQVVPEIDNPDVVYETLWTIPNNKGYLELVAIMQKFIDQGISTNTNYDPSKFDGGKVPMKVLLQDLLTAYKLGVKTLYYHQTRDGADDTQNDVGADCESGACAI